MGSYSFVEANPLQIEGQCLEWLQKAANHSVITTVSKMAQIASLGHGKIIYIKKEILFHGVIGIVFSQRDCGRVMTLLLLGGEDIEEWKDDLAEYLYKMAEDNGCEHFFYMGRPGFSKLWPELKEYARVYTVDLKKNPKNIK